MRHVAGVEEMEEFDRCPDALVWLRPEKIERPNIRTKDQCKERHGEVAEGEVVKDRSKWRQLVYSRLTL